MSRCPHGYDDDGCAMFSCSEECAKEYWKLYDEERGIKPVANYDRANVGTVKDVEHRFWRNDLRTGRNIYVLLSNDINAPSELDPLLGTMETTILAEDVVNSHNGLLERYGRRYAERIAQEVPQEVGPSPVERLRGNASE